MNVAYYFLRPFAKIVLSGAMLLLIFTVTRFVFLLYNHQFFPDISARECFSIFYSGIGQDMISILLLNSVCILLMFIAAYFPLTKKNIFPVAKWIFILSNVFGLALNILDVGYFRYSRQRTNLNLLYVFSDSIGSFKSIITGYLFLILFFIALVFLLVKIAGYFFSLTDPFTADPKRIFLRQVIFLLFIFLFVKGWTGNIILPSSPLLYIESSHLPIAQNSVYTFAYSVLRKQNQLTPKNYFSAQELGELVSSAHHLTGTQPMQKKNVVICILESFSRGYLIPGNHNKANTPFFDSLIKKSIFFQNAFANGFQSNQGIVSILGGLPGFLDEPFYYSAYANTPLKSIGNILKENGYSTNFLMGTGKDHFGFEKFGRIAGIDNYYGRLDFNNDQFYDGNWGIFDEPFLQYGSEVLAKKKEPFMAVVFNISSHPPYTIPKEHQLDFNFPGQSRAQQSISYVDYSFRRFFESCQHTSWFQNTIFVFCADHYLVTNTSNGNNPLLYSTIPIFIYIPAQSTGMVDTTVIGQVDITPSLLHLLNYTGDYTGFGRDVFDSARHEHYVLNKPGHLFQIISRDFVLGYDPYKEQSAYLYKYDVDGSISQNLIDSSNYGATRKKMEIFLKANVQLYNKSLLNRSLE